MQMPRRYLEFVYLDLFERTAKGILHEDDRRALETRLLENPRMGATERETGGVRKVRIPLEGRGKRGGARVIYVYDEVCETIYLLFVFPKNRKASLTDADRKMFRQLVTILKE